jgi:acetylornithine deacetylase/succinyl-diaminopimelate desuccinylase-like protein
MTATMPDSSHDLNAITSLITAEHAKALMIELARVPSPLTELLEGEPKLREFVDIAVEPRLREMGLTDIHRDSMGNLLATCGCGQSGRSLMLVTNAMNQPAATMPNPYGGEVREGTPYGLPGEVVLGKGLSEQKAPLASILLALRSILAARITLSGRLVFLCCVSGETGRHDAIRSIIEATGMRAKMAILNGTGNRISLGNRGRVDVAITVHGSPGHSSRPASACNAITGALEVVRRLDDGLRFTASHPSLGRPTLAVNRIRSAPDSTHTIQDRCEIGIDRRLLPGEDPDAAVAEISTIAMTVDGAKDPASGKASHVKPWRVEVVKGPFMYPSLVSDSSEVVGALTRASQSALGVAPELFYQTNAFDQGYLNHIGIEACTYGPGEEKYAHTDLDMASVNRTRDAAKVYAALILQRLV